MTGQVYFLGLKCVACGAEYDNHNSYATCGKCGGLLDPQYDYQAVNNRIGIILQRRDNSIWRWRELLPVLSEDHIVTLGEGGTPLIRSPRLAAYCGVSELYIKNDTVNPTGSLKDRSVPIAASKALEFGCDTLACDSTGNKAASVAAYASRAGLKSVVFCPAATSKEKLAQTLYYGAQVVRIEGDYTAVNNLYKKLMEEGVPGWYDCGTGNPYRYEGKKTYAYEVAESLNWQVPDRMVHPANGGMSIYKTYKGFVELNKLGLVNGIPKMTVVQPADYASIANAARSGEDIRAVAGGKTLASALAARDPGDLGRLSLSAIRASKGTGVAVGDEEIEESMRQLAAEGILAEPSGAVTIIGLRRLVEDGLVGSNERVVCVLTGSGFKDFSYIAEKVTIPESVPLEISAVRAKVSIR